jgi:hypothetical protein
MVSLSSITITADGERLMCGGFSLSKTIRLGNFEFIANYFGSLSIYHKRGDSGTTFMGSTHSGDSSPWWVMIEDSYMELHTSSSGDEGFRLPSPMTHGTGAPLAPITTTPSMENAPAAQAMVMVPCGWRHHSRKKASLMSDVMLVTGGSNHKHMLRSPPPSRRQCPGEASSTASKPLPWSNCTHCHSMSAHSRRRGS